MAEIQIFNNDKRVARTSKAFEIFITRELMRMYTLSFAIPNKYRARAYINSTAQYIADGQAYDTVGYVKNSGNTNITTVTAEHVSYRLNNYTLAAGYAFVGTIAAIAADILDKATDTDGAKASTEFEIGTTPDLGTVSFALNNTAPVTAKYAILALINSGIECDFDNFTINLAEAISSGNSETFEFGVNMSDVSITYAKSNGTTYQLKIANLQRITGTTGHDFDIGDTVTIVDSLTGESFTSRIITYIKCLDDPTRDTISLGDFIADASTAAVATQIKVDNSIQQAEQYSNVSIDHANGFMAVNSAATQRVKMNANDCFVVQIKEGTEWVTVAELTENGLSANRITTPDDSTVYGIIGSIGEQYGLQVKDDEDIAFFGVYRITDGFSMYNNNAPVLGSDATQTVLSCEQEGITSKVICNANGVRFVKDDVVYGLTGSYAVGTKTLTFSGGVCTSIV